MMDTDSQVNFFDNQDVTEFVSLAAEYCTFVENTNNFLKSDFVKKSIHILSGLYYYGLKLPRLENSEVAAPEKYVTELEWNDIYEKVNTKLGYHADYLDVYDPVAKEEGEISIASLADNFADLYQDIKDFTTAYGFGNDEVMEGAIYDLVYNFEEYWGMKLLSALRALHRLYFSDEDLQEDDQEQDDKPENKSNWLFEERRKQSKNKGNEI
jgi:hypothetical protein